MVAGRIILQCVVCRGDRFQYRQVSMNTPGMTMMGWDWLNKSATGVVCLRCGYVHQFMQPVQWETPPPTG